MPPPLHQASQSAVTESSPDYIPPLRRSSTLPVTVPVQGTSRSLLAPEDAIYQGSPPRMQPAAMSRLQKTLRMTSKPNLSASASARLPSRGRTHKEESRSGSRSRRKAFKKLLWVQQMYPDNYTDQDTFLEHLQRNPRLQPYDFWPLVADSTVIVQHVCSVIIFVVCFIGIVQNRIDSGAVVSLGSIATFLGWLLWDWWVGQDDSAHSPSPPQIFSSSSNPSVLPSAASSTTNLPNTNSHTPSGLGLGLTARPTHSASATSLYSQGSTTTSQGPVSRTGHKFPSPYSAQFSNRASLRLSTAKSALLIYFTLLGLSPILKSLTESTSSDSIWAMSFLLFAINIFFFDYGTPPPSNSGNKNIPASLSTNAALMASTVLASRLPSTDQVFSLTLFSIEIFGLFPVFRRYSRQRSWRGHVTLTALLVLGAGGGVGLCIGHGGDGDGILDFPWKAGITGTVLGVVATGLAMGACSWWLISMQKYKNEIHGPWDPARPIIRRHYEFGYETL